MLENNLATIALVLTICLFLFFVTIYIYNKRELQFLKERIKLNNELEHNVQEEKEKRIFSLIEPLTNELQKLQANVNYIEKNRQESYGRLSEQVNLLSNETRQLEQALKSPTLRGRWGEVQLQRVLELSGMIEHVDYEKQKTLSEGMLKPDAIVNIPGKRSIAIDAKTPLEFYIEATESKTEEQKEENLVKHAKNIKQTVQRLSQKEYQNAIDSNLDFVIMFIPGDHFFSAALKYDPNLFENAFKNKVLICTPATLIALLKGIAFNWQQDKLSKNVQEVSLHAQELQIRVIKFFEYLDGIRSGLETAGSQYDKAIGSIQKRIIPQIQRIADLGTMDDKKLKVPPAKTQLKLRNIPSKKYKKK